MTIAFDGNTTDTVFTISIRAYLNVPVRMGYAQAMDERDSIAAALASDHGEGLIGNAIAAALNVERHEVLMIGPDVEPTEDTRQRIAVYEAEADCILEPNRKASAVKRITWNKKTRRMVVEFKNGERREYLNVDWGYAQAINESVGEFKDFIIMIGQWGLEQSKDFHHKENDNGK